MKWPSWQSFCSVTKQVSSRGRCIQVGLAFLPVKRKQYSPLTLSYVQLMAVQWLNKPKPAG